jgi:hypothetical protein
MAISMENASMLVKVLRTGALQIVDKSNGTVWGSSIPGWVTVRDGNAVERVALPKAVGIDKTDQGVNVSFTSLLSPVLGRIDFQMNVIFTLTEDSLVMEIRSLDTPLELESVEYPAQLNLIASGIKDAYLVVPFKQGVIIPSRLDAGFMRFMHNTWKAISDIDRIVPFESGALNMPWFGVNNGSSGLFNCVLTPADCSLHVLGNAVVSDEGLAVDARQGKNPGKRVSCLSPIWRSSHGKLGYGRKLEMRVVSSGYVEMTKLYRQYSKRSGRYVSLREKIEENPSVERIIGAPDIKIYVYTNRPNTPYFRSWSEPVLDGYSRVHTTFNQVVEIAQDLKCSGVDRALILLGGWNRAGYDREHVDMWPPAEQAGGVEGLAKASKEITSLGYLFSLHDNYQDFYPDAPSYDERFLMKDNDGAIRLGGVWDGGLCRLICSSQAFELANRNLDLVQHSTEVNSYYLDTTTAASLYECFDERHPITREEDLTNKLSLLRSLWNRGLVVGGEGGTDWAIPVCSFFEGLPGSSVGFYSGIESVGFGLVAPLFNLVYHDAVVSYWQHGQPFGREDHANHVLHDLMNAQPSSWSLVYDQWQDLRPLIRQAYELLGRLHLRTAHHEMLSHQYVTDDYAVHETTFADGTEVTVNFGITSIEHWSICIPPKGFALRVPGEMTKVGALSRDIIYRY